MTVIIYIWNPQHISSEVSAALYSNVGHVSMSIKNNIYISHRPQQEENNEELYELEKYAQKHEKNFYVNYRMIDLSKKYLIMKPVREADSTNYNYEKECTAKSRNADITAKIEGLNEDKMLEYYEKRNKTYHPLTQNCSEIVAKMIISSLDKDKQRKCVTESISADLIKSDQGLIPFFIELIGQKFIENRSHNNLFYFGKLWKIATNGLELSSLPKTIWKNLVWTPDRVYDLIKILEKIGFDVTIIN